MTREERKERIKFLKAKQLSYETHLVPIVEELAVLLKEDWEDHIQAFNKKYNPVTVQRCQIKEPCHFKWPDGEEFDYTP